MEGNFELNKHGFYTVQNVEENDFLNEKLESDQYGLWYSIKFENDASTHLWQTKTPPVEGEKYWGWIENTKSGKATKFKWDKQNTPDGEHKPPAKSSQTEDNIARAVALKAAVEYSAGREVQQAIEQVVEDANVFLGWLKGEKPPTEDKEEPEEDAPNPGYDKAKQQRDKVDEVFNTDEMPPDFLDKE